MMKVGLFVQVFIVCSLYELALSQTAAQLAEYHGMQQSCINELKIPAAEATQILAEKDVTNGSEGYKCFHSCLYKKMGLLTGDNKPNDDMIVKFAQMRFKNLPLDKLKAQLASCAASTAKAATNCEYINKYEQCMVKALKA